MRSETLTTCLTICLKITAARAEIGIYDGAPYGYYLVNDNQGERKILAYFDGPDIRTALRDALQEDQASRAGSDTTAPPDDSSSRNTSSMRTQRLHQAVR